MAIKKSIKFWKMMEKSMPSIKKGCSKEVKRLEKILSYKIKKSRTGK